MSQNWINSTGTRDGSGNEFLKFQPQLIQSPMQVLTLSEIEAVNEHFHRESSHCY